MRQGSFLDERAYLQRSSADTRPVLVFVTYTGLGDFIMALPLFGMLRSDFYVLPVVKSSAEDIARLLCQDGLLEGYLLFQLFFPIPLGVPHTAVSVFHAPAKG